MSICKYVRKRDGRKDEFSHEKIKNAILKAMAHSEDGFGEDPDMADYFTKDVVYEIEQRCIFDNVDTIPVDDVHDIVEDRLMSSSRPDVAKEYIRYRNQRNLARKADSMRVFDSIVKAQANDITRENANMNADTPAGMMMKFASESSKTYVDEVLLSDDVRKAVKDNLLHIHDKDYYPTKSLTCIAADVPVEVLLHDNAGVKTVQSTVFSCFDSFFRDAVSERTALVSLVPGHEVYVHGRNVLWTRVMSVSRRMLGLYDELMRVTLEDGTVLKLTGTHVLPYLDYNYKEQVQEARNLKEGYKLYRMSADRSDGVLLDSMEVTRIERLPSKGVVVYDLETAEHWFQANGVIVHNCIQHPTDKLLKEGFVDGHASVRPAKRIETAATVACITMEAVQNEMHGGQAIPAFDFYMAPYVRAAFEEEVNKCCEDLLVQLSDVEAIRRMALEKPITDYIAGEIDCASNLTTDVNRAHADRVWQIAVNRTVKRVHQAMESFVHNMNTIHSRGGNQVVFSSINYGTDTSPEGRCIIREILNTTYEGVGNGETAIFPIQIWKKKRGVSYLPGDPNYDLYCFACKVTARRFFPNFLNLDASYNRDDAWKADDPRRFEHEVATMGCRTRVYENRFGPKTSIGRGNLSFSTINLPGLAIRVMENPDREERIRDFFTELGELLDLTARQLDERFRFQSSAMAKQFPMLMNGMWFGSEKLGPNDSVAPVLNQGTLGIGFIGLAECLIALIGKHQGESEEAQDLGLAIVSFMREKVNGYCEKYKHNYSVLATPAEGLAGRFTKIDRKRFGIIPGVTDKEYYTNSNHVPVYYKCTPEHKARVEGPYHALTTGGHIFYVEMNGDATHNPEAIMQVVDLMDKYNIGYGSVNHNRTRCLDCGFETADGGLKVCPRCGGTRLDLLQRITGYLVGTTDRWNSGKKAELKDRVVHE